MKPAPPTADLITNLLVEVFDLEGTINLVLSDIEYIEGKCFANMRVGLTMWLCETSQSPKRQQSKTLWFWLSGQVWQRNQTLMTTAWLDFYSPYKDFLVPEKFCFMNFCFKILGSLTLVVVASNLGTICRFTKTFVLDIMLSKAALWQSERIKQTFSQNHPAVQKCTTYNTQTTHWIEKPHINRTGLIRKKLAMRQPTRWEPLDIFSPRRWTCLTPWLWRRLLTFVQHIWAVGKRAWPYQWKPWKEVVFLTWGKPLLFRLVWRPESKYRSEFCSSAIFWDLHPWGCKSGVSPIYIFEEEDKRRYPNTSWDPVGEASVDSLFLNICTSLFYDLILQLPPPSWHMS